MEAIILSSVPYQENGRVLSLFTSEYGVISAIVKNVHSKKSLLTNVLSPLSYSNLELTRGKSDLYQIGDATLVHPFLSIRNDLEKLSAAGKILQALKKSQLPENPAPLVFSLTLSYLKRLESSLNPGAISISFLGKILRYEGLFPERIEESEVPFDEGDWNALCTLAFSKSFEEIEKTPPSSELDKNLNALFALSFDFI